MILIIKIHSSEGLLAACSLEKNTTLIRWNEGQHKPGFGLLIYLVHSKQTLCTSFRLRFGF
jgi:hypothetical protein